MKIKGFTKSRIYKGELSTHVSVVITTLGSYNLKPGFQ